MPRSGFELRLLTKLLLLLDAHNGLRLCASNIEPLARSDFASNQIVKDPRGPTTISRLRRKLNFPPASKAVSSVPNSSPGKFQGANVRPENSWVPKNSESLKEPLQMAAIRSFL